MTEKHCMLRRGCHTFAIFSQLNKRFNFFVVTQFIFIVYNCCHLEISRKRRTCSDWLIVSKLRCKLQRCYTQATCLAALRKVEDSSTSLATRNATIAVAKWGVTRQIFLAFCNTTFVALQVARKIASSNMAFNFASNCLLFIIISTSRFFFATLIMQTKIFCIFCFKTKLTF